jgi:hypothetical protein
VPSELGLSVRRGERSLVRLMDGEAAVQQLDAAADVDLRAPRKVALDGGERHLAGVHRVLVGIAGFLDRRRRHEFLHKLGDFAKRRVSGAGDVVGERVGLADR